MIAFVFLIFVGAVWAQNDTSSINCTVTCNSYPEGYTSFLQTFHNESHVYGRIEICHGGCLGTVCDDGFDDSDAQVACRSMSYDNGEAATYSFANTLGYVTNESEQIWLDDVGCDGSEMDLTACISNGWGNHNCQHSEDAAVFCWDDQLELGPLCTEGAVEFYSSMSDSSGTYGLLQVCHGNVWGTICDDSFESNNNGATVACDQMGFTSGGEFYDSGLWGGVNDTGMPIFLDGLVCDGSESRLSECPNNGWGINDCAHNEDAGVLCYGGDTTTCNEGELGMWPEFQRSGMYNVQGLLRVCHNNIWGSICDDYFDNVAADLACRQLGYLSGGFDENASSTSGTMDSSVQIWKDDVRCTGWEASVLDCPSNEWGDHNCGHNEDVGVICYF